MAESHLVKRDRRRIAFGCQVPSRRLAELQERVAVAFGADVEVIERGTDQRKIEEYELVPLLGERTDADVVGFDVSMDNAMPLQRSERRQEVVPITREQVETRHAFLGQ